MSLSGTAGLRFNETGKGELGAALVGLENDLKVDSIKFEGGHYKMLQSLVNDLTSAITPVGPVVRVGRLVS